MSTPRVWLITGSSSGFGLEMARCALKHGDKVVATLRKPDVLRELAARHTPDQLLFVKVDVTKPDEIKEAFRRAKAAFGRVDVVFNNAGYVVAGEVEAVPDDPARAMFETNFWGAAHVSQEAVRFFRDENKPQGGHLITNTAAGGLSGYPIIGWYCASKHALEGLTETLYRELNPKWNIRITAVEPGGFKTDIASGRELVPAHPAYTEEGLITSIVRKAFADPDASQGGYSDPAKGVQKIYELSQLSNPPLRLPLGPDGVKFVRDHIAELSAEVDKYASWSDNLLVDT